MTEHAEPRWAAPSDVSTTREDAFVDYVRQRKQSLLRTAYVLTGDSHAAEDLVQSALTELYRSWDHVNDLRSLDGYVRRIMVNANISAWRRPWRRREVPASGLIPDRPQLVTDDPDTRNVVWELVRTLPVKQRTVIVLRYLEDMPVEEIAEIIGVAPGTVKSRANRAIATLRANSELAGLEDLA